MRPLFTPTYMVPSVHTVFLGWGNRKGHIHIRLPPSKLNSIPKWTRLTKATAPHVRDALTVTIPKKFLLREFELGYTVGGGGGHHLYLSRPLVSFRAITDYTEGKGYGVGWSEVLCGHIACGPGSYYLSDESITVMDKSVTTYEAALARVTEMSQQDPKNPVVLWQLADPWGNGVVGNVYQKHGMYLVAHKAKFLKQNLDATTGGTAMDFARAIEGFQKGQMWGSPMYVLEARGEAEFEVPMATAVAVNVQDVGRSLGVWNGVDGDAQVTMQLRNGLFMSAGPFSDTGGSNRVDQADRSDARAVWTARKDGRKGFKFEAMGLNREASGADHWTSGTGWWLSRCKQVTNWDASEETIRVKDLKGWWFSLETNQSGGPVEVFIEHAAVTLAAVKVGFY